jgi:hypothetical protein
LAISIALSGWRVLQLFETGADKRSAHILSGSTEKIQVLAERDAHTSAHIGYYNGWSGYDYEV